MDIQQPKPQSKEYKDLIRELEKGIIQIPKFQSEILYVRVYENKQDYSSKYIYC